MAGTLDKQFRKRGYIHKSELRPRPENKNHVTVKDFFAKVKGEVFENLDNSVDNGFIQSKSSMEIVDSILISTTGDFAKAGRIVLCTCVEEWRKINLTEGGE